MSPLTMIRRLGLLAIACALPLGAAQDAGSAAPQPAAPTGAADAAVVPAPDPVVARLGDQVETLASLQDRFEIAIRSLVAAQGMAMNDTLRAQLLPFLPQYLDQRASEMVLLAEAAERGLVADEAEVDAVVARIEGNVPEGSSLTELLAGAGFRDEEQLRTLVRESNLVGQVVAFVTEGVVVTEAQITLAYQATKAGYSRPETVCASHILVATDAEAQAVLRALEGGADFAEEARSKSTDPGGADGGDLGCFERNRMVEPFADAAFAAPVGTPIGPVASEFGFHVILVHGHDAGGVAPLAEVHDEVEQRVRQMHAEQLIQALVKGSGIQTFPDRLPPPPPAPDPQAPATPDPAAPDPAAPDAEAPAPDAPASDAPDSEAPDSEAPAPDAPAPEAPASDTTEP